MTWYKTGTATVTSGSPVVTINDANAELNIFPDDGFVGPDGRTYAVLSVQNATTITLSQDYAGDSADAQPYVIIPTADHTQLRDMLIGVNTLITEYSELLGRAGAGRFDGGNALQPGVRGIDHDSTGLVWNNDGTLSIAVNGVIVASFTGSGGGTVTSVNGESGDVVITIDKIDDLRTQLDAREYKLIEGSGISIDRNDPIAPIISATGGGGTVSSVGLSVPTGLVVANSPVTSTGTLTITYQAGYQGYTTAEANKLDGIAAGATKNQTDTYLLDRANHTGTQAISTIADLQVTLGAKEDKSAKGAAGGYASLDASGKIPSAQIPPVALTEPFVVASQAEMLALAAQIGDVAIRTDVSKTFMLRVEPSTDLANWTELLSPPQGVMSVNGQAGPNVVIPAATPAQDGLMAAEDKSKLDGIADNADVTTADLMATRVNTLSASALPVTNQWFFMGNGTTPRKVYWQTLQSYFLSRSNHTGTQAISTIANLQVTLDTKVDLSGEQTLADKTLSEPVINGYVEGYTADGGKTTFEPDISDSTIFFYTLPAPGAHYIVIPPAVIGKSFTIAVTRDFPASPIYWLGATLRWPDGVEPRDWGDDSGKIYVFTFLCVTAGEWLAFLSGGNM